MANLRNELSWSFSAAGDFEICRRKRYWSKYIAWGGWNQDANPIRQAAYRLNKMDSRFTLQGKVVEKALLWMLQEQQAGRPVTADAAYEQVARPELNAAWKQSKSGAWRDDPKRNCCLHEHYYPAHHEVAEADWTATLREQVQHGLRQAETTVLPRLAHVQAADVVALDAPETTKKMEGFDWEGVMIYAVPDYVYRQGDTWHIHDWKTGKPKPEHLGQVALYGLWAHRKHAVPPENITVYLEYLQEGRVAAEPITADLLASVEDSIKSSIYDMLDYLEDGDPKRNEPRPKEEWDMTPDRTICKRCNFYELCAPEF